ncbi:hypothetical protein [Azobacteroides phage ProJPt-Bp1]|uniref:Uncharacterized protein n=1 Tax=Azobacteroides phage ProJPt-Bp1 TaxID=1920526 RepID=A0A1V1FY08_9CAUD|nr:hypothetical protein KNT10_gp49 [Azobacteroides phage ProJPt-Bp1]BAX03414.1 hypothetical protein [Azobacteroides phage ProJPt-Bp1]
MPLSNSGVEEYTIRTHGDMNGYAANDKEIMEGRTHGANYKRILVTNGQEEFMTRYAYDIDKQIDKENNRFKVHIWAGWNSREFYDCLHALKDDKNYAKVGVYNDVFISRNEDDNWDKYALHCEHIYLKTDAVKLFNKVEADEYLKEHPETNVFKRC